MTVIGFTIPFVNTPSFFTGTASSNLVPDIFPVGINGRPYALDLKSGEFARSFDPRTRDSVDQSTAPGEAAINPGGLWRRGEVSWHFGAGQKYADVAGSVDYRYFSSKGVNPWSRGQLTLLNDIALAAGSGAPTTNVGKIVTTDTAIYVIDGTTVKYATSFTGTWTTITSPAGTTQLKDIATDGTYIFACFTATTSGVYATPIASPGTWTRMIHDNLDRIGYVNGRLLGSAANVLYDGTTRAYSSGSIAAGDTLVTHKNTGFVWTGFAPSNTHLYACGYAGDRGLVYKTTIKADGTSLDAASVALQLPKGEVPHGLAGYLGNIFIGTNKGVRYASTDASGNLTVGALIATGNPVYGFTFDDRFAWFTWTAYDGSSTGLGRLDLSQFIAANTPAYASDLMYTSQAAVLSLQSFGSAKLFSVSGVGIVYETVGTLVASGNITTGVYRWGIPDRKFIVKIDTRALPLVGTIATEFALDGGNYTTAGTWSGDGDTENSFSGSEQKAIEAQFRFTLTRQSASSGPTFTRWLARAYATPYRSELFQIPVLIHNRIRRKDKDFYFDPTEELGELRDLIKNPKIVTLQIENETVPVIVETVDWRPLDTVDSDWIWQGTATVTMRSVQE